MAKILYVNPQGKPRSRSSYSARKSFKFCKRQFKLTRIDGWTEKRIGASFEFGKMVEAAVKYHIQNHGSGGPEKFIELWEQCKKLPAFLKWQYSALEESWENLLVVGTELLWIFALKYPKLPMVDHRYAKPQFQVALRKIVFPDTPEYNELENDAYLDILCTVDAQHPWLPKVEGLTGARLLLIDVKTASKMLMEQLVRLDPQLVEYAWMTRVLDVAFLWFVKQGRGYKSGSRVTLMENVNEVFKAGYEYVVLEKGKETTLIGTSAMFKAYGAEPEPMIYWLIAGAERVANDRLSKQRLQFAAARLTDEEVDEAGKLVGHTMVEMVMAHDEGFYPQEGGIRFPDEKCNLCPMRYICSGDSAGRDQFLTRAGEEWLDVSEEL